MYWRAMCIRKKTFTANLIIKIYPRYIELDWGLWNGKFIFSSRLSAVWSANLNVSDSCDTFCENCDWYITRIVLAKNSRIEKIITWFAHFERKKHGYHCNLNQYIIILFWDWKRTENPRIIISRNSSVIAHNFFLFITTSFFLSWESCNRIGKKKIKNTIQRCWNAYDSQIVLMWTDKNSFAYGVYLPRADIATPHSIVTSTNAIPFLWESEYFCRARFVVVARVMHISVCVTDWVPSIPKPIQPYRPKHIC